MGKKKTYQISDQQHKRVDVFRTIQLPTASNSNVNFIEPTNRLYPDVNHYSNETFVSSNSNLGPNVILSNQHRLNKQPPPLPPHQTVWSTSASHSNNTAAAVNKSRYLAKRKSQKKITISICVAVVLFLVLVTVILLAVYFSVFAVKHTKCSKLCALNEICLLSAKNQNSSAKCECKPGYENTSLTCEQRTCFGDFVPYTYLNGVSSESAQIPVAYESKQIKPYCCPNSNYLTSACCGVSFPNVSLQVSKRIIGGNVLPMGVFPWIVFVTQVYRTGPNKEIQMVKNCSGTLLNEMYVLTAAHCVEIDRDVIAFNAEFSSVETVMRVYFGFTDKSKALKSNVIVNYERKIKKVIRHPKYDPMYLLNDLAILRLDKPIPRSANSDYLCLFNYDKQDMIVSQSKLYTAGWGSTSPDHLNLLYPDVINYVDAIVFPMSFCKYIYPGLKLY